MTVSNEVSNLEIEKIEILDELFSKGERWVEGDYERGVMRYHNGFIGIIYEKNKFVLYYRHSDNSDSLFLEETHHYFMTPLGFKKLVRLYIREFKYSILRKY